MTDTALPVPASSNLPATAASVGGAPEGLEDFTNEDMVMPRLTILHQEGVFQDTLSNEKFGELEVVLLGLVKQRILWPPEMEAEKKPPLCKSFNYTEGRPDGENPSRFPWKASGFAMADHVDGENPPVLTCEGCALKEWGSHPKSDTPWCSEQHVLPLMMSVGGGFSPAILTLQRTAIKPSKAYMTSFARSQSPLFVTTTKLSLSVQRRGTVTYSVPIFARGTATEVEDHPEFALTYRRIRDYLTTPRVEVVEDVVEGTPVAAPPTAARPASSVDDEMPF